MWSSESEQIRADKQGSCYQDLNLHKSWNQDAGGYIHYK